MAKIKSSCIRSGELLHKDMSQTHEIAGNRTEYASKPHILVVDDDDRIRDLLVRYLQEQDFVVCAAANAEEAKDILLLASFDILVVDVMMPGQDGMSLTEELRQNNETPIILLTAMGEVEDKIKGLTKGADDYVTKPFDPRELVLRIQAILKRQLSPRANLNQKKKLKIGQWIFDPEYKELQGDQSNQSLTDVEVTLLNALSQSLGELITRDQLADLCAIDPDKRTIDVQVTRLRRKLEENTQMPRYLQTVRGKGYILRGEYI